MESILLNLLKPIATLASGLGKQKKLFILIYHRVLDEPDFMRPGEVDKKKFSWQMALMAKYFNVLPLAEALERMQNDTLPPRAVCITFDDGYADNYLNALPILQKNNLSATFFIASGFLNGGRMWNDTIIEMLRSYPEPSIDLNAVQLGVYSTGTTIEKQKASEQIIQQIKHLPAQQRAEYSNYISTFVKTLPDDLMMTDDQLLKLHQSGMEIGGHTVTHPIMAKIPTDQVKQEVLENKQILESLLNTDINFFAYPNGKPEQDYLLNQVQLIKNNKYQAGVSTQWGVANKKTDIYQLPRFTPWDIKPVKFMLRIILMFRKAVK